MTPDNLSTERTSRFVPNYIWLETVRQFLTTNAWYHKDSVYDRSYLHIKLRIFGK